MRRLFSLLLAALAGLASADSDDWLSPGKLGHLVATGGITTVGAGMAHEKLRVDRRRAALYGASAALVAGGLKELYDWRWGETRRFDLRDIALDVAGAGLGIASTEAVAAGWLRPRHRTAGKILTATGAAILTSTLLAGVSVLALEEQNQRRDWCLPVGFAGVGGLALCLASHFVERANPR
jgi:uncharacterized protein YfiM (DUF2279 family)